MEIETHFFPSHRTLRHGKVAAFLKMIAIAIGAGFIQAQAAIYTFSLSGSVDAGVVWDNTSPPYQYHQWSIYYLSGMGNYAPHFGDVLDVTVTLDRSYTIPASVAGTILSVGFSFRGYPNPDYTVGTTTTAAFFNQGVQGLTTTDATSSGTTGGVSGAMTIYYNAPVTFDKVVFQSTLTSVGGALNLNQAHLTATQISPVPEPSSMAVAGMGLGIFAFLKRRHG